MQTYNWWTEVPEHLKTKTQLGKMGLKPCGEPKACVYIRRYRETYNLYDITEATPKRQMSEAQRAAATKASEAAKRKRLSCAHCGEFDDQSEYIDIPYYDDRSDRVQYRRGPRWCQRCINLHLSMNDMEERAERAADAAQSVEHTRKLLAPDAHPWCILDTETTGLDYNSQIVQVAVISPDGDVLLDTLVQPTCPVSDGARSVHHISDEALATAPTFWQVYPRLVQAVRDKRVVVYNVAYDRMVLDWCCSLYDLPMLPARTWKCAMELYASYAGEWSEYHQSYKWQRLNGDHTALGDCRAVLALLHRVARDEEQLRAAERIKWEVKALRWEWDARRLKRE